jgi:hypothetical protein
MNSCAAKRLVQGVSVWPRRKEAVFFSYVTDNEGARQVW